MEVNFNNYKIEALKLFDSTTSSIHRSFIEFKQNVSKSHEYLSRQVTVLAGKVKQGASDLLMGEYGPRTQTLLFSIPVIGNIFWLAQEIRLHEEHVAAIESNSPERVVRVIELKNEMVRSQLASMLIKTALYVASGSVLLPVIIVTYTGIATFEFVRLMENEDCLDKYRNHPTWPNLIGAF